MKRGEIVPAMNWQRALIVALSTGSLFSFSCADAQSLQWTRQIGTSEGEDGDAVSADRLGNVYVSGSTNGSLGGPSAGSRDAFVTKYDAAGGLQWTRQWGTVTYDFGLGVSADGLGNVFVSGSTYGNLGGQNAGSQDAFVSKLDAAGNLLWTRQLGTNDEDLSFAVSADGLGNAYIAGFTRGNLARLNSFFPDAFVTKYDGSGNLLWTRQLGTTAFDVARGVSADAFGNVYISGYTMGSLGGPNTGESDAFLAKYDAAGALQWTRQLGTTAADDSFGVSTDGLGGAYISGYTSGSLGGPNSGGMDAFVSRYSAAGDLQWVRQIGTTSSDTSYSVSSDGSGHVYISGESFGSLGGPNAGIRDAFVIEYDSAGNFLWARQFGTAGNDFSSGVSADWMGNVYVAGEVSRASAGGPFGTDTDAIVAKYTGVPEPSALLLLAFSLLMPHFRRFR